MPGKSRGCAFARFTFILWICELPQWFIDYINWYAKQEKERMRKIEREPFNFYCARVQKNVFRKTLCRNKMAKVLQIIFEKDISFYRYNAQTNATTTKSKKKRSGNIISLHKFEIHDYYYYIWNELTFVSMINFNKREWEWKRRREELLCSNGFARKFYKKIPLRAYKSLSLTYQPNEMYIFSISEWSYWSQRRWRL